MECKKVKDVFEVEYGYTSQEDNALFFTCSLVDYIARKTKNIRSDVVNQLGKKRLEKIYNFADTYYSTDIDYVSLEFIKAAGIKTGTFDNVGECKYSIPSHWDIGRVYRRLIKQVAKSEKLEIIDALMKVCNSFISAKIDDYNSSVYYENPSYIFECYRENKML